MNETEVESCPPVTGELERLCPRIVFEAMFHFYSLAFKDGSSTASVFVGCGDGVVTMPLILEAKQSVGMREGAVMLSCCYLGHMTDRKFNGG